MRLHQRYIRSYDDLADIEDGLVYHTNEDAEFVKDGVWICQPSARLARSIAMPYSCYSTHDQKERSYDFSFVGSLLSDERRFLLSRFASEALTKFRVLIATRPGYWFRLDAGTKSSAGDAYADSLSRSRFVLCPMGVGSQSQRFFEVMASGGVPVFMGHDDQKFPLDWEIDWADLVPRVSMRDAESGNIIKKLGPWIDRSDDDLIAVGRELRRIYRERLDVHRAPEIRNRFLGSVMSMLGVQSHRFSRI